MFGKKKNNNKFNENEIIYKELHNDTAKRLVELREQVCDVEIKTKVIPLYPECYEKFEATTELETAKIKLHGKINAYMKAVEDAKNFYKAHEDNIHFPAYQTPSVTKIIEIAYRSMYKI